LEKTLREKMVRVIRLSDTGIAFEDLLDEFISSSEEEIQDTLNQLLIDKEIWKNEENRFTLLENESFVYGRFLAHEKGFGFVHRLSEEGDDIFVEEKNKNGALHQDLVMVKLKKMRTKSDEGKVLSIVERGMKKIVGTFQQDSLGTFVVPDDKRLPIKIFIPSEFHAGAVVGHKVYCELFEYLVDGNAKGKIIEILGHQNDPGVDILSIVYKHDIPTEFPEDVQEQAISIPDEVPEEAIMNRRDLRDQTIVTIDGEDAKDLDDAVTVTKLDNGNYLLGVHIADVSHYVPQGSPIDKEAYWRGTSVYLVDRVIPMIPHRLSNGICSLNPHVNRLVLSCEMEFDPSGNLVNYDIFESVIKTTERMTYKDVNHLIAKDNEEVSKRYKNLLPFFDTMYELSLILRRKRFDEGAIDFDIKEAKILVDENCQPTEIVERTRGEAERLIEDFMLAANDTIAYHLCKEALPGMFRVHESPSPAKLYHFANFITMFGYRLKGKVDEMTSKQLQNFIERIQGKKEEPIISRVLLRSMQKAKYSDVNSGHFGLAKEFYTHFTSPIRRYPDLIVHRLLREFVINKSDPNTLTLALGEIAERASMTERRAVDAERETQELKKTEYMKDRIGERFQGIICSVTKFGFFVELPNTIEGIVHVSSLQDDHYEFDEGKLQLVGKRKKKVFAIGDSVSVSLVKADIDERKMYFELAKEEKETKKPKKKSFRDRFNSLYEQ